ncbi:hypothetical protein SAMN05216188_103216 [Lentzea xinjiangensis]|uniref:Uncharacterized protein n=1 Tax=Lentzea xinjiangensis TaxID=402600 RepID=A0A1H9GHG5_9PSEU|nr:hypothetical protein SAMN05216188_103216 [Lentzea xinjiangensis]
MPGVCPQHHHYFGEAVQRRRRAYLPSPWFLQVGGGSGFSGLHGQPEEGGTVVVDVGGGGGGSGFVTAGGGVVLFGGCCVLGGELVEVTGASLLLGTGLGVELGGVLDVDWIQVESGVRLSGSSPATPWIAMPTSTPSNADPSTAEPPAAHSARTAVLLNAHGWKSGDHAARHISG